MPSMLEKTRFGQLGFFLPDELAYILQENNSEILLKSKFTAEYKMVDFMGKGGEKAVIAAQKFIDFKSICNKKFF